MDIRSLLALAEIDPVRIAHFEQELANESGLVAWVYGTIVMIGLLLDVALLIYWRARPILWNQRLSRLLWRPWGARELVTLAVFLGALQMTAGFAGDFLREFGARQHFSEGSVVLVVETFILHVAGIVMVAALLARNRVSWRSGFGIGATHLLKRVAQGVVFLLAAMPPLLFYTLIYHFALQSFGVEAVPQDVLFAISDETFDPDARLLHPARRRAGAGLRGIAVSRHPAARARAADADQHGHRHRVAAVRARALQRGVFCPALRALLRVLHGLYLHGVIGCPDRHAQPVQPCYHFNPAGHAMKTAGQIGERALIARLARRLRAGLHVSAGIGDDSAVVRVPGSKYDLLYTTDAVIEGAHFLRSAGAAGIGHKAAARVLSDIAAMGGEPMYLLVNLVCARGTSVARLEAVYRAMAATAERHGAAVIGGDTASGRVLELHVFGVGRVARGGALLRSGARRGDVIYVTGRLGGSIHGKHLTFQPRLREGQWLRGWATSMIDLSDGLATDLSHITAQSCAGADVQAGRVHARCARAAKNLAGALTDGEDFELLFTVPRKKSSAFEKAWRAKFKLACAAIGTISSRRGIRMDGRKMTASGFEHFHQ